MTSGKERPESDIIVCHWGFGPKAAYLASLILTTLKLIYLQLRCSACSAHSR